MKNRSTLSTAEVTTYNDDTRHSVLSNSIKSFLVIIGLVLAAYYGNWPQLKQKFPDLGDPKTMTYNWDYEGRLYSLSFTVYGSVYSYYKNEPKGVFIDHEESSLRKYLVLPAEDNSIKVLTSKLDDLAVSNGLDEDQRLELAVSFVQNIPYDAEKAKTDRTHPRYAYEVLFDNKGICSDKSFLMYAILRQMGYGSAVFEYPSEEHMNVGVQTDAQYSTDSSGYTMIETTNAKLKIGVIPSLDASSRQALEDQSLQEFNLRNPNTTFGKKLSSPLIFAKTAGKKYYGVIRTFQTERDIADIQNYLTLQGPIIEQKEVELYALEQRLYGLKAGNNIPAYNALIPPHNKLANELRSLIDDYNAEANRYNALIEYLLN